MTTALFGLEDETFPLRMSIIFEIYPFSILAFALEAPLFLLSRSRQLKAT